MGFQHPLAESGRHLQEALPGRREILAAANPGQSRSQIVLILNNIRGQIGRPFECGLRLLQPAASAQGETEIVVRLGEIRLETQGGI